MLVERGLLIDIVPQIDICYFQTNSGEHLPMLNHSISMGLVAPKSPALRMRTTGVLPPAILANRSGLGLRRKDDK